MVKNPRMLRADLQALYSHGKGLQTQLPAAAQGNRLDSVPSRLTKPLQLGCKAASVNGCQKLCLEPKSVHISVSHWLRYVGGPPNLETGSI